MRHSERFDKRRQDPIGEVPDYLRERLALLREAFGERPFTVAEAHQNFSTSRNLTYKILQQLTDRGLLRRLGRGVYVAENDEAVTYPAASLSDALRKACTALSSEGLRFFVTGLDILHPFTQHLLVRYPHLLYVERGAGEWAKQVLGTRGYKVALDPGEEALELALELTEDEPLLVLRETAQFYGAEARKATPEKAFVDLYFEVTRAKYPLSLSEVGRILFHMLRQGYVNYSRLLHAARRRGLEREVRCILNDLSFTLPIPAPFLEGAMDANEHTRVIKETVGGMLR